VSELPKGWCEARLDEVSRVVTGKTPSKKNQEYFNGSIPFIKPGDVINQGVIESTIETISAEGAKTVPTIPAGSVTVTCIGNLGRAAITKVISATNQQINTAIPHAEISSRYLYYYLLTIKEWMEKESSATTVAIINKSRFSAAPIKVAPKNEQIRIVHKLDSMLAKVDAAQARLDKIPNILKRFRQSVLAAATSGELTNSKEKYQLVELKQIASNIVDCPHSTPKWTESGKYCIRTTAFNPFFLDLSKQGFVSEETYDERIQRLIPNTGDILYSREGTIGIACQIPQRIELCLGQRMVIIRAGDLISPEYLTIVLNSDVILSKVKKLTVGTTVPRINMKDIRAFMIPLPSIEEQNEIVRRVESLFSMEGTVEKQLEDAKARTNRLTQSILAKAFRGDLVAQDPNDESAEKLLARILTDKEDNAASKSSRKSLTKMVNTNKKNAISNKGIDETSVIKWIENLEKDTFSNEDLNKSFGSEYEKLKEIIFSLLKEDKPIITRIFDAAKKDFMYKKV
jgi:type I restriction enzyme S subunit